MKKILLALALLALLIAPSYAITFSGVRMGNPDTTTLTGNKAVDMANIGQLTFMKDYTIVDDNTLLDATEQNFTQTNGSPVAGYLPSRSPSIASTKFTTSGDMTIVTTSNARRQTEGYMNENGFSLARGELIEGSATNLLKDSYFADGSTTYWIANAAGGALEATNAVPNILGGGKTLHVTTDGVNKGFVNAVAARPILSGATVYTLSATIQGTGSVILIFSDGGTTVTSSVFTLTSTPKTFHVTGTSGSTTNNFITVRQSGAGTADFYVHNMQITQTAFPTSYIPTTTAAVTRAAEPLTYPTAGNINSLENISIVMRYRPVMLPSEGNSFKLFSLPIDANNFINILHYNVAGNAIYVEAKSGGVNNYALPSSPFNFTRYSEHVIVATMSTTADGLGNKISFYLDGVLVASNVAYVAPIGTLPSAFNLFLQHSAILQDFAIYQKALTQAEVTKIQTILTTEN